MSTVPGNTDDSEIDEQIDNLLGVSVIARRHPDKYGDPKKIMQKKLIKELLVQETNKARLDELERLRPLVHPHDGNDAIADILDDRSKALTADKEQ